jgi:hypothetical protein
MNFESNTDRVKLIQIWKEILLFESKFRENKTTFTYYFAEPGNYIGFDFGISKNIMHNFFRTR